MLQKVQAGLAFSSASFLALVLLCGDAFATDYAYVRSNVGEPWGRSDNINTMNTLFGAANVETWLYESLDFNALFASDRRVIFMTGGDNNSPALGGFIASNQAAMENWVAAGGSLVIMAAENSGGLSNLGFGASWASGVSGDGIVTDASHPIYAGTGLSNGQLLDGDAFHHDHLSGSGFTTLMTSSSNGSPILMEREWGAGNVILGTLTLNFFVSHPLWDQPESQIIQENIFLHADAQAVPEPTTVVLFGVGVCGLARRRRRR